jgi:Na+-transporting NADH:ubiquinone oxidoreductase subunit B
VRGLWNANRVTLAFIIGLLSPLGQALYAAGPALLPGLAAALAAALGFEAIFARWRGRPFTAGGVVTAITVVVMLPPAVSPWQIALGVAFGVVLGEQIFGGRGRNFLNPAVVALAFLIFSFPDGGFAKGGLVGWASCVPGAILLMVAGLVSWRIIAAALVGLIGATYAAGGGFVPGDLLAGGFVFGLIFLACDPVTSAATNTGRWLYGLIIGVLVTVAGSGGPAAVDSVIFAILVGGIFAPLIDQGVIGLNAFLRRRRYGQA